MHDAVHISFSQKGEIPRLKRAENNRAALAGRDPDLVSNLQASWSNAEETIVGSEKPPPHTNDEIYFISHLRMPGDVQDRNFTPLPVQMLKLPPINPRIRRLPFQQSLLNQAKMVS